MDSWDAKDYSLLGAALLGVKNDVDSTKGLIKRGGEETNPFLSKSPSGQELDKYGALAGLVGTGAALLVPEGYRKPLLGAWAGLEHGLARYNTEYNTKHGGGGFEDGLVKALIPALVGGFLGKLSSTPSIDLGVGSVDDAPTLKLTKSF